MREVKIMESNTSHTLDKNKFKKLIMRIYQAERENFKTKKLQKNEMVERIRKMIEFEVGKDDN